MSLLDSLLGRAGGPSGPDADTVERGALLLAGSQRSPNPLARLQPDEARRVMRYTERVAFAAGTVVMAQGEKAGRGTPSDTMLLILDGELSIAQTVVSRTEPFVLTLLGPGSFVGEMGVITGAARTATCTANTDVVAARMSRASLMQLLQDAPAVGVKLLLQLAELLAENLRDSSQKLFLYVQLVQAMDAEMGAKLPDEAREYTAQELGAEGEDDTDVEWISQPPAAAPGHGAGPSAGVGPASAPAAAAAPARGPSRDEVLRREDLPTEPLPRRADA
jgi:CRP-like cAMP-binding protein